LDFEKNVKNVKNVSIVSHTPGFNKLTQLPEVSTGKSPKSSILLRNAGNQNVPSSEWVTLGELGTELQ